jgi:hypothetical protein
MVAHERYYMLRADGKDVTVFPAAGDAEAEGRVRTLQAACTDVTTQFSWLPLRQALEERRMALQKGTTHA